LSFFSTSIVGFTILEGLIDTIWASRSLTVAAYKTVLPELHKASFLTVCQADFNLNSKLSRKTLSFYRYLYINARLVVHQGQPIHFQIFQIGDNMLTNIFTIGLGGEEEVIGWFLGYPSVTATEGGENEIPFSYQ
jgi:hypothetical protein